MTSREEPTAPSRMEAWSSTHKAICMAPPTAGAPTTREGSFRSRPNACSGAPVLAIFEILEVFGKISCHSHRSYYPGLEHHESPTPPPRKRSPRSEGPEKPG